MRALALILVFVRGATVGSNTCARTAAAACTGVLVAFSTTGLAVASTVPSCLHGAVAAAHCRVKDSLRLTQCARQCELVVGGCACESGVAEATLDEALSSTDGASTVAHLMHHLSTARFATDGTQRASANEEEVCFDIVVGTTPYQGWSAASATPLRRMLCVDVANEDFWAESTWVSLARASGTSAVAPAVRFPATLRVVQPISPGDDASVHSENTQHHVRGTNHSVQVIVSLGRGGVSVPSSLDTTTTALLWAGPSSSVPNLALPHWLRPVSMEQQMNDDEDTWCDRSSSEENPCVVIVSVPRQSVPPSVLRISESLDRYDAAVAAISMGRTSPSPPSSSSSPLASLRTTAFSFGGSTSYATYGELTDEGAARLFVKIGLGRHDVFYDLGSGDGKVRARS